MNHQIITNNKSVNYVYHLGMTNPVNPSSPKVFYTCDNWEKVYRFKSKVLNQLNYFIGKHVFVDEFALNDSNVCYLGRVFLTVKGEE